MFKRKPRPKLAKKWEGDFTTIHKHYKHIIIPIGGVALVGTLTAAIALPIMITKIAKEEATKAFEKIIPIGGTRRVFEKNHPITYLAIGDSVTAGYNGFMKADGTATAASKPGGVKGDYLSYADFLASNLQKNGMLKEYRNFAVSGFTIPQSRALLLRDQGNLALLQKTDLISLSLGANDFLSAVQVLNIPFRSLTSGAATATSPSTITEINTARDLLFKTFDLKESQEGIDRHYALSPSGYAAKEGIKKLIMDSFDKLITMTKKGELAGVLDIQKDLYDKVFGLIQLDLATYINELHQAAPHAQIEVMGYAFPFHKLPTTIVDGTIQDKGVSLKDAFNKFIDTLKETTARASFVDFFDINKLKEFGPHSDIIQYAAHKDDGSVGRIAGITNDEWDRVMPNAFDIHPSTYGHQVIAGYLFDELMTASGIKVPDYKSIQKIPARTETKQELIDLYKTYSYAGLDMLDSAVLTDIGLSSTDTAGMDKANIFKIQDEYVKDSHFGAVLGMNLLNDGDVVKLIGNFLFNSIDENKLGNHYQDVISALTIDANTNAAYVDTQAKYDGITAALATIVKDGSKAKAMASELIKPGTLLEKIKNIAPTLIDLVKNDMEDNDFKGMILGLLKDLGDVTINDKKTPIMSQLENIISAPGNQNFITDMIAMLIHLNVADDSSNVLQLFKKYVAGLSVQERVSIFDKVNSIAIALITKKGFWIPYDPTKPADPKPGHNFNASRNGDVQAFIDALVAAGKRLDLKVIPDATLKDATSKLVDLIMTSSEKEAQLTKGLERVGLHDEKYFIAHPEAYYDQES